MTTDKTESPAKPFPGSPTGNRSGVGAPAEDKQGKPPAGQDKPSKPFPGSPTGNASGVGAEKKPGKD